MHFGHEFCIYIAAPDPVDCFYVHWPLVGAFGRPGSEGIWPYLHLCCLTRMLTDFCRILLVKTGSCGADTAAASVIAGGGTLPREPLTQCDDVEASGMQVFGIIFICVA